MRGARALAGIVSLLALAACTHPDGTELTQRPDAPLGPPSRWLCEDGRTLTTTFYDEPARVDIRFSDGTRRTLPRVASASGALYEADTLRFHTKANEAYFAEGEHVTNCEESPKE